MKEIYLIKDNKKTAKSILVVEDESKIRRLYSKLLKEEGFNVIEASNAASAYDILRERKVDLVLLDIKMPQIEGNLLYEALKFVHIDVSVIVASVYPVEVQQRMIPGAKDYYDKSQGISVLLEKIRKAMMFNGKRGRRVNP